MSASPLAATTWAARPPRAHVTAAAPTVGVAVFHDRGAMAALAPAWRRLAAAMAADGGTRGPFVTPAWLSLFAAALAPGRDFRLVVAHHDGELCGALPLLGESRRLAGVRARVWRSPSDDHAQRFDLLLAPGALGDAAARALVAELVRDASWDAVELRSLPAMSPSGARLAAAARAAGLRVGDWPASDSPYLPLPADGAALDGQLDAKFRANLRRRARKLAAEVGAVTLERVDAGDAARLDAALDDGFALEAAGWKGARGTAIACDPALRRRYRAIARSFARSGELALYFLRVGGRRVAFHFALVDGGIYYLLKPGYDPALANYGLGHLLVEAVARDLVARGVRELDFLGEDMPWKREWTGRTRAHVFRYLFAPTLRGRALHALKLVVAPRLAAAAASAQARRAAWLATVRARAAALSARATELVARPARAPRS